MRLKLLGFGIILIPSLLFAGQISGSVTADGRGVAGTAIDINCSGAITHGVTAGDGSYRINVPQQGQCSLTLTGYSGPPSAIVFSYPNPAQYNFDLVHRSDGNYELRRR
jgi:hypothetical protein